MTSFGFIWTGDFHLSRCVGRWGRRK